MTSRPILMAISSPLPTPLGFTTNQQLLSDAAKNGKGEYYTADNAQQLTEAFQGAIVGILSQATTFTSPGCSFGYSTTDTQSRDEVFYAMFKPSVLC